MKAVEQFLNFMRYLTILLVVLVMAGCNSGCKQIQQQNTLVNTIFTNASTNDLDWVRLKWQGPYAAAGILPKGISAGILDISWPYLPSAALTFVNDKTRQHYSIDVSFASANEQIKSGKCHEVNIRILSYEKAEVVCQ